MRLDQALVGRGLLRSRARARAAIEAGSVAVNGTVTRKMARPVADWRTHLPGRIVMPHPSPRNNIWLKKNPWFAEETLPAVRARVAEVTGG